MHCGWLNLWRKLVHSFQVFIWNKNKYPLSFNFYWWKNRLASKKLIWTEGIHLGISPVTNFKSCCSHISLNLTAIKPEYLLFCCSCWFNWVMDVFHSPLYHTHRIRSLCFWVNTFVGNNCCNISKHWFQLCVSLLLRYL